MIQTTKSLLNKVTFMEPFEAVSNVINFDRSTCVSFLNFHAIEVAHKDTYMYDAVMQSDYLFRDGVAVEKLFLKLGIDPGYNLNGTDLIPAILKEALNFDIPIVLIGASPTNSKLATKKLQEHGHNVVLSVDGYRTSEEYISLVRELKNNAIIIIGMGMPRQEKLSFALKNSIETNHIYINGGAIIDRISGDVNRCPVWMQRLKIEWLYRFIKEPVRLFDRIFLGSFRFVSIWLRLK